jgi:hypothetical protein
MAVMKATILLKLVQQRVQSVPLEELPLVEGFPNAPCAQRASTREKLAQQNVFNVNQVLTLVGKVFLSVRLV